MTKKLAVTIRLEMEVPDEWTLAQTSDGIDVLSIGNDQYLDLTFEPMVTDDVDGQWTNAVSEAFMDGLLEMVEAEDVYYEITSSMH